MKKGFTLIELLVVIAIIAILAILSLPKVLGLFETAKKKVFIIEAQSLLQAAELKVSKDTFFSSGSVTEFYLEDLQGQVKIKEGYYGKIVLENNVFKITLTDGKYFIDNLSKEEITPKALEEAVLLESQFQRNVGSGGTYTLKNSGTSNEAKFFAGPNPNNWIQFGKDNNHYILMWRIIKANAEGIKIIYEGIRNGNNFPTADGRVTIDGTELIAWHTSNGNKWKTATLKSKLENWYNSLRIELNGALEVWEKELDIVLLQYQFLNLLQQNV